MPLNVTKWEDCWAKCNATATCHTWAASMPQCGSTTQCWLKAGYDMATTDAPCRVSGVQQGGPPPPTPTSATFGTVSVPGPTPGTEAIHLGAATQLPLSSSNDRMSWGVAYLLVNPKQETGAIGYAKPLREAFRSGKPAPAAPSSPANLIAEDASDGPLALSLTHTASAGKNSSC